MILEPKKRQLWLKVWFNKLEKAESENSNFFELLEEEEPDLHHHALNPCDMKNGETVESTEIGNQENQLLTDTSILSTNDNIVYSTNKSIDNIEEDPALMVPICNNPQAASNWITFEETYKIKQRSWSQDSSSSSVSSYTSSSSSEMSTTSSDSSS